MTADGQLPNAARAAVEAALAAVAESAAAAAERVALEPASAADPERDLALLRRFEPIVKYTKGELFFPMSAVPYIAQCELWAGTSEREQELLVPLGQLTAEDLPSHAGGSPGKRQYLRFVQEPPVFFAKLRPGQQVRPAGGGPQQGLLAPPAPHLLVMSAYQHLRHRLVPVNRGASVLGVFQ